MHGFTRLFARLEWITLSHNAGAASAIFLGPCLGRSPWPHPWSTEAAATTLVYAGKSLFCGIRRVIPQGSLWAPRRGLSLKKGVLSTPKLFLRQSAWQDRLHSTDSTTKSSRKETRAMLFSTFRRAG